MGMRVDPAWRHGEGGQVIENGVRRRSAANPCDLRAFDHDDGVVQCLALSIEECRGPEHNWPRLGGQRSRAEQQEEESPHSRFLLEYALTTYTNRVSRALVAGSLVISFLLCAAGGCKSTPHAKPQPQIGW